MKYAELTQCTDSWRDGCDDGCDVGCLVGDDAVGDAVLGIAYMNTLCEEKENFADPAT